MYKMKSYSNDVLIDFVFDYLFFKVIIQYHVQHPL